MAKMTVEAAIEVLKAMPKDKIVNISFENNGSNDSDRPDGSYIGPYGSGSQMR